MWSCTTLHVALQALFVTLFVSSFHFLDGTAVQHFPAEGDSAKQKGGKLWAVAAAGWRARRSAASLDHNRSVLKLNMLHLVLSKAIFWPYKSGLSATLLYEEQGTRLPSLTTEGWLLVSHYTCCIWFSAKPVSDHRIVVSAVPVCSSCMKIKAQYCLPKSLQFLLSDYTCCILFSANPNFDHTTSVTTAVLIVKPV